jgi:methionyl-tRNA formyltransferase
MPGNKLNIVFMGTPVFAVAALNALHAAGHNIVCVYCQPPRPAGRGHKLQPSPVQARAEELGLMVRHPVSLKKDAAAREEFKNLKADVAIVAAYGLILPQDVLDAPKYGCINIHGSLLPRWRGAAPIQRAILAGDTETGICIMQMEAGLDTGPVLMKDSIAITPQTTSASLHDDLAAMAASLIVQTLGNIDALRPEIQPEEGVTYAHMLTKDEGRIDWTKPAAEIERQLRALSPWPGVWCMVKGERMKVLSATVVDGKGTPGEVLHRDLIIACGAGALRLDKIQPQDRKPMDGASFMNGTHMKLGDRLE